MSITLSVSAFKLPGQKEAKAPVNYTEWVAGQDFPSVNDDDVKLFYPSTLEDGKAVIKGEEKVKGLSREKVFLASWLYFMENYDAEQGEMILKANPEKYSFSALMLRVSGTSTKEAMFAQQIDVKAIEGGFTFEVSDARIKYKEKGLIPRTLELEALHPESNSRHTELVVTMVEEIGKYFDDMARFDAMQTNISAPKMAEVLRGKVTEGMNQYEVKLVLGEPWETRKSGEKTRWIYPDEITVIFEDGKVTRVVGQH